MPEEREIPRRKIVLDLDLEQLGACPVEQAADVCLLPLHRTITVEPDESIFEAARRAGIALASTCGGKGTCGRCRLRFPTPAREPSAVERQLLTRAELAEGIRLACRSRKQIPKTATIVEERYQHQRR
jgi:Na+-transporting NADH:ubiquinone oxidoreductase subunit NqrF